MDRVVVERMVVGWSQERGKSNDFSSGDYVAGHGGISSTSRHGRSGICSRSPLTTVKVLEFNCSRSAPAVQSVCAIPLDADSGSEEWQGGGGGL